jgi:hypothetical protein
MNSIRVPAARVWQHGVTLWDALARYGTPETWKAYEAIDPSRAMAKSASPFLIGLLVEMFQPVADAASRKQSLLRELQTEIIAGAARGELLRVGFVVPRRATDEPAWVTSDLWPRDRIEWTESSVSGNGLSFVAVRVLHREALAQLEADTSEARNAGRGPKSARPYIEKAVTDLISTSKLDPQAPHKVNAGLVREYVNKHYAADFPGKKGLNDETIRKIMVRMLKQHR